MPTLSLIQGYSMFTLEAIKIFNSESSFFSVTQIQLAETADTSDY